MGILEQQSGTEMPASPSIDASMLHRESPDDALARVERFLGPADDQTSPLLRYRWRSEFQADWKQEIGHWLHTAEEHGYCDRLVARVIERRKTNHDSAVDASDRPHLVLQQELAAAQVCHYLTRTTFGFAAWEAETGGAIDIDLRLRAPDGREVNVQVKGSGSPGVAADPRRPSNDDRIVIALEKAARQLPTGREQPALIAVTALTGSPLAVDCGSVIEHCVGSTTTQWGRTSLLAANVGRFFESGWEHVSGVAMLDYMRGVDTFRYACTVLMNPHAKVAASPDWFPYGRVLVLDEQRTFRWVRGRPYDAVTVRDGTPLDLPP